MHGIQKLLQPTGLLTVLVAIATQSASGNGGGYQYGVEFTGGVAPFEPTGVEKVQILEEKLNIVIDDDEAEVEVNYVMKNLGKSSELVTFGFPIEAMNWGILDEFGEPSIEPKKGDLSWAGKQEVTAMLKMAAEHHCSEYSLTVDGKEWKHQHDIEPFAAGWLKPFPGSEMLKGVIGWKVSSVWFKAGKEHKLTIRYRVDHERAGSITTRGFSNLAPVFRYRLSTGGVWAGPIAKGTVRVKFVGAQSGWAEIRKPAGKFKRLIADKSDTWIWNFENLEPTRAHDIEIVAGPETEVTGWKELDGYRDPVNIIKQEGRWQVEHQNYSVIPSSTLKPQNGTSFEASNIKGLEWHRGKFVQGETAWSEGVDGQGIGESLTLLVKKPLPLDTIKIRTGLGKSRELFEANSRPAELTVTLNSEFSFTAKLKDRNRSQMIHLPESYRKPVKSVVLEIDKVFPGGKFSNTCISHLRLIGRLDGNPLVKGKK